MPILDHLVLRDLIPESEIVRRRLAIVLTEADLLRSQLRVSKRLTKERERLEQQQEEEERNAP